MTNLISNSGIYLSELSTFYHSSIASKGNSNIFLACGDSKNNVQIKSCFNIDSPNPFIIKKNIKICKKTFKDLCQEIESLFEKLERDINIEKDKIFLSLLKASSQTHDVFKYKKFSYDILGEMISQLIQWDNLPSYLIVSNKVWKDIINFPHKKIVKVSEIKRGKALSSFNNAEISFRPCESKNLIETGIIGYFDIWNQSILIVSDFQYRKSVLKNNECFLIGKSQWGCYYESFYVDPTSYEYKIIIIVKKPQSIIYGSSGL